MPCQKNAGFCFGRGRQRKKGCCMRGILTGPMRPPFYERGNYGKGKCDRKGVRLLPIGVFLVILSRIRDRISGFQRNAGNCRVSDRSVRWHFFRTEK